MPYFRRRRFNFTRRRRRGGFGNFGPSMRRPRWTRRKRVAQNLTREVRWFKSVGSLNTETPAGWIRFTMSPNAGGFTNIEQAIQFTKFGSIWEEYKVLKMIARFTPAHVGTESIVDDGAVPGTNWAPRYYRGNLVTWVDPQGDSSGITNIISVMGKPSARLHQPRHFIKRWLDRPRSGFPTWGTLNPNGTVNNPDGWNGMIRAFGESFTPPQVTNPNLQVFYYVEILYKVMFRSRHDS